jgi:hypothetical protein
VSHKNGDEWSYPERLDSYFRHAENASLTIDENMIVFNVFIPNEYHTVFYSERDSFGNWTEPQRIDEINNYGIAFYPRIDANGSRIYFVAELAGGEGGTDIWYVERPTAVHDEEYKHEKHLISIYPNPSNSYFNILIEGSYDSASTLFIYDILGRKVRMLVDEKQRPGGHRISWDGRDDEGNPMPSGVYFGQIQSPAGNSNKIRMILLK